MSPVIVHDILVNYMGNVTRIPNVDPKNYSYLQLLNDVYERALSAVPGGVNVLLHMQCGIPKTTGRIDIIDDQSVKEMLKVHENKLVINLYVLDMDIIPDNGKNAQGNYGNQTSQDNSKIDTNAEKQRVECHSDKDDEIYVSSSDESWKYILDLDDVDGIDDERLSFSSTHSSDSFSSYEDNDEVPIIPDSESDEEIDHMKAAMKSNMWVHNPREDIEFEKGQLFTNVDAFRAALKDYVIQKCFPIVRLKNEKSRCTAKCGVEGCNWRIHASPIADFVTFMIKSYNPVHTCVMNRNNVEATSDWIAKKLVDVLRDHPEIGVEGIKAEMQKYGVTPSKNQLYRAKKKAEDEIDGTHAEAYSKLPKYAELIRETNAGSICKIHYDRPNLLVEPRFLRLFVSFKAQKDGFLASCRPFVGFDGCHLKGPYGGVLLTAVALDGNNSIFPLAFAVAECENKETWSWFFHFFEEFYGPFGNNVPLTVMSDRQKGLNLAYEEIIPQADARYCCRHIQSNFKVKFPGLLLSSYFWQAAKSFDIIGHNEAMERIKDLNLDAWRYLEQIPKTAWARYAFSTAIKCDHVTNNFTESFNAWIGKLRGRPILSLADGLRAKFMKKLHKRFQKACTWTTAITPKMTKKLREIAQHSRRCDLMMASEDVFEVRDVDKTYIVKLSDKSCECGAFQLTGMPCKHAALEIVYKREKIETYCDHVFSKDQYLKAYASMIHPIPCEKRWPSMPNVLPKIVMPPPLRRAPGRPKKNRRREAGEGAPPSQLKRSTTFKCSNCGAFGHNRRTCSRAPVNAKRGNTIAGNQVTARRAKPGRGIASTGLAGAVLWDNAQGSIPIVVSSQGRSQTPLTRDANLQAGPSGSKKKRGRPYKCKKTI